MTTRNGRGAGGTTSSHTGFTASTALAGNLQRVLVDLIALHLNAKQAHWNVVGSNFRDIHLQLDEITDSAREYSDTIAERMRALYAVPDGRPMTAAKNTTLPELPPGEKSTAEVVDLMTDQIQHVAQTVRMVHDEVDAEDPSTADLLHSIIDDMEKQAWMLAMENRTR
jgi:starvation-inducible DNA-binding protein